MKSFQIILGLLIAALVVSEVILSLKVSALQKMLAEYNAGRVGGSAADLEKTYKQFLGE